jgi:hypothetical protein
MERHEQIAIIVAKFFQESRDVNPYASAETMRALDHIIHNSLADGLARAASKWRQVYQELSRAAGVPTRDNPLPDAQLMQRARSAKRMADTLSDWVSRVHALAAPANDRVYHRIRDNDQFLELLIAQDYNIALTAEQIDHLADTLTPATAESLEPTFSAALSTLESAVRERARMFAVTA